MNIELQIIQLIMPLTITCVGGHNAWKRKGGESLKNETYKELRHYHDS